LPHLARKNQDSHFFCKKDGKNICISIAGTIDYLESCSIRAIVGSKALPRHNIIKGEK